MAGGGRIRDEDIALVRERSSLVDIASEQVTLKPAGGGNLKGLCPFHDEKTPSFTVAGPRNVYFCHGCGEGGDVINFVQKIDHLSFVEAVERLAERAGITLRRMEAGPAPTRPAGQRQRLVEAHKAAAGVLRRAVADARRAGGAGVPCGSAGSTATRRSVTAAASPRPTGIC